MRYFSKEYILYLYENYERHFTTAGFIIGFILDTLTLRRIDLFIENAVLFFYLTIASAGILLSNLYDNGIFRSKAKWFGWFARVSEAARPFFPFVIQVAFGALFSGFTVFYLRSASVAASWPFLLFLVFLLVGNEFFRTRYQELNFQITVLFIAIFSYMIFLVPILAGKMGPDVFILSGAISLFVIWLFIRGLAQFIPERIRAAQHILALIVVSILGVMNVLYFLNIIPPIPLALKEIGAYHSVVRTAEGYYAEVEDRPWYSFLLPYEKMNIMRGSSLYVYSAIFAPTRIDTEIVHHWEYLSGNEWLTQSRVRYSISGGRDGGYRGYSVKQNVQSGWWQVSVETARGQVVGRIRFQVKEVGELPKLRVKEL